MHLLWTLFIGFIVGALAKFLTPGRDPGGFLVTICIGIAGSLIATFLGRMMGWYGPNASAGFIASLVGAILLLVIYHAFRRRTA
ncbi:MAG TPA: GlsB/YeaQ/YmgE family stress response membrane protein [Bryobacteraceae bacterium]|nr:GlsB/YeaQ/YmgE family stress response membrane protein [Bryobacteraceae bacterium]